MNPLRWSLRAQFLLGFLICVGLLGYALYVQFVMQIEPCPMCIFQRLAFAATGLLFLIAAIHGPKTATAARGYGLATFAGAATGMGIAGKHVWTQLFPPEMPSCAPGWDYLVQTNSWLGVMKKVLGAKGDCSTIDWSFLGLSMPMWSLLCFVLLGAWAIYVGSRKRRLHG